MLASTLSFLTPLFSNMHKARTTNASYAKIPLCQFVLVLPVWLGLLVQPAVFVRSAASAAGTPTSTELALLPKQRPRQLFASQGPVLTVTLPNTDASNFNDRNIITSLEPSLTYSIASQQPPLPHWLPALKSMATGIGYQFDSQQQQQQGPIPLQSSKGKEQSQRQARRHFGSLLVPSWLEVVAKLQFAQAKSHVKNVQWLIQPRHDWATRTSSVVLQANRGAQSIHVRLASSSSTSSSDESADDSDTSTLSSTKRRFPFMSRLTRRRGMGLGLQAIKGSFYWPLPLASLASLRISPLLQFGQSSSQSTRLSCDVQATTGGAGRTVATLSVNAQRPTLSVQYQPDRYNWIKPVIDLYTGHMEYQWIVALPNNCGSIHTTVDPATAICVTWTDYSKSGQVNVDNDETTGSGSASAAGGTWVTDIRIPLTGGSTTLRTLAADIRVRRQFRF